MNCIYINNLSRDSLLLYAGKIPTDSRPANTCLSATQLRRSYIIPKPIPSPMHIRNPKPYANRDLFLKFGNRMDVLSRLLNLPE